MAEITPIFIFGCFFVAAVFWFQLWSIKKGMWWIGALEVSYAKILGIWIFSNMTGVFFLAIYQVFSGKGSVLAADLSLPILLLTFYLRIFCKTTLRKSLIVVLLSVVSLWALFLLTRNFVVTPYKIPTVGMSPTLHGDPKYGDKILANRLVYFFSKPKRGDILIFRTLGIEGLNMDKIYIQRLVGLPGDKVSIQNERLYINGQAVQDPEFFRNQPYIYRESSPMKFGSPNNPTTVPSNHYFVLGDNSSNSKDSRYFGPIPAKNVLGRADCIWCPLYRIKDLKEN